jgi:hypothetical protein
VTKTLLFLGEGSNAVSGTATIDWGWGKKFRAYDKATGSVIWEMELPSGTTAGPMTYLLKGKQHIVVSVGARDHSPRVRGARASLKGARAGTLSTTEGAIVLLDQRGRVGKAIGPAEVAVPIGRGGMAQFYWFEGVPGRGPGAGPGDSL